MESSSGSSKRARAKLNNEVHVVMCMVYGCAADLSACKKYYQCLKVCEIHAKSPQVSINGQNQRFCQQCSRFQSLGGFDGRKRSCRKSLDRHNIRRRRRKPIPYISSLYHGTNMVQSAGQQDPHPTMALTNLLRNEAVQTLPWLDRLNRVHFLLSSTVAPPHASISSSLDPGSVSVTTSSLDHGLGYGGLENGCDVGLGWRDRYGYLSS